MSLLCKYNHNDIQQLKEKIRSEVNANTNGDVLANAKDIDDDDDELEPITPKFNLGTTCPPPFGLISLLLSAISTLSLKYNASKSFMFFVFKSFIIS